MLPGREARHLSREQLLDFVERQLGDAERSTVEAHLSSCSACTQRATDFRRLIDIMHADDDQDAPAHVINRAIRLLRVHRLTADADPPRRRVPAVLRFDSALQPLQFGQRAGAPTTRELVFEIGEDNELEVRLEYVEGNWRVAGQILGECSGGTVLLDGVGGRATTALNSQCEFSLPPQPGAIYKLILQLEDADVEIPILELRG